MSIQMAPLHKFKVYRLRPATDTAASSEDRITPEDLAEMLTILSHEAKLGPVVNILSGADPAVIVGELVGFVGIEVGSGLVAPVVQAMPAPPAGAKRGR